MNCKLIGSDYLLILLYLNDKEPIRGAVRLTKMMFLFNEQIVPALKNKGLHSEKLPDFIPYNYGPFSKELYEQVEFFSGINFIQVKDLYEDEEMSNIDNIVEKEFIDECYKDDDDETKSENNFWEYSITDIGSNFVEDELLDKIEGEQLELLKQFKKKITEMSIKQLLYYVYKRYPEYTEKSIIKDEVLSHGE